MNKWVVAGGVLTVIFFLYSLSTVLPADHDELDQDIVDRLNEHNTEPIEFSTEKGHAGFQGGFWVSTDLLHGGRVSTTVNYPQIDYCKGGIEPDTTELLNSYPMIKDIYWHTYDEQADHLNEDTRVSIYMTGGYIDVNTQEGQVMDRSMAIDHLRNNGTIHCGTAFKPGSNSTFTG